MTPEVHYLPGQPPAQASPLARYLPPIPQGVGAAWVADRLPAGSWVLEPFGASPALAVEVARAGYRVLVAANNPIARFLLELHAAPPADSELRATLADLAASTRGDERLERHIRSLYLTPCAACGHSVEARAFIWERDAQAPSGRIYTCPTCGDSGERPATQADAQLAGRYTSGGLHRARALERVAPMDDPDREYAIEALEMYPPRAVYVLFTLVNKLDSFPAEQRRLLEALLLAAFEQSSVLWPQPASRARPRQLTTPARYLEKNIWLSLEEAVLQWSARPGESPEPLPLETWPALPPESGGLCIFEGRLKDLADQKTEHPSAFQIEAVLAAIPRPNQAFWTLSALWAGWLWGHAASEPFHSVLRRRRYDWGWHTVALYAAFRHLFALAPSGCACLGLTSEVEPGLFTAALLAAQFTGFTLQGIALRTGAEQAQVHWERAAEAPQRAPAADLPVLTAALRQAGQDYLLRRGEPVPYICLHAAGLKNLAQAGLLHLPPEISPGDVIRQIDDATQEAFVYQSNFVHYVGGARSQSASHGRESGSWWLEENYLPAAPAPSLADRVEIQVVRHLITHPGCSFTEIDAALCAALNGLETPDRELVRACLVSYGEETSPESDKWRLRPEDAPAQRRRDLADIHNLLVEFGQRLGFQASGAIVEALASDDRTPVAWQRPASALSYTFHPLVSGILGKVVFDPGESTRPPRPLSGDPAGGRRPPRQVIILPGGRAGLVDYKLRRDPRLRAAVESGWRLVKFRHLRWLAQNEALTLDNLDEQLGLDPLSNQDPQMLLL